MIRGLLIGLCATLLTSPVAASDSLPGALEEARDQGILYVKKRRFKQALAHLNRGDLYRRLGKSVKAVAEFQTVVSFLSDAIELNPNDSRLYTLRGAAYSRLDCLEAAIADLDEAIRRAPEIAKSYRHRGEVLYKQQRHTAAIADFDKGLSIDTRNPIIVRLRAAAYEALGEVARAAEDLRLAEQLENAH